MGGDVRDTNDRLNGKIASAKLYTTALSASDILSDYNSSNAQQQPTIYFQNGTCKCPNASAGDTATISGTTYTAVNNSTIAGQISSGNVNLCTTLVTSMSNLFKDNHSFNSNIGFWDTSNVTNMSNLFDHARVFNQNIGNWDVSNVTNMS